MMGKVVMYTRYVLWILLGIPPSSDDDDIEIHRDPHSDGISVESARQPSHSLYDHNDNISYLGTIAEDDAEDIISVHLFDHDDERPRPFWKRYERPAWIIRIVILSALLVTLAVSLATKHNETGGSNLDVDVDVPFPSASPSKPSLSTSTSATFEGSSPSVEKSVLLINMQSPKRTPLVLVEEKNGVFVDFPLDICEGDCDHDSDCRGSLVCYQRWAYEPVPGCLGEGVEGKDYCCNRPADYLFWVGNGVRTPEDKLSLCSGDCDTDAECADDLVCFQRSGYTAVPGCQGIGRANSDYCISLDLEQTSASFLPQITSNSMADGTIVSPTSGPVTVSPTKSPAYWAPVKLPTPSPITVERNPSDGTTDTIANSILITPGSSIGTSSGGVSLSSNAGGTTQLVELIEPSPPPTKQPSSSPSKQPTPPTPPPSRSPTQEPASALPTKQPSKSPSRTPSRRPTKRPTSLPTPRPSKRPTALPTPRPSKTPTNRPSPRPTRNPTLPPTRRPSPPTPLPTPPPTPPPTPLPSRQPTPPTENPSSQLSLQPSIQSSGQPSSSSSNHPSISILPSASPSSPPTMVSSLSPSLSVHPTLVPSGRPSSQPSLWPSRHPYGLPSGWPSSQPSPQPWSQPSLQPSRQPAGLPSGRPTPQLSSQPSSQPSSHPSSQPSHQPSEQTSSQPSNQSSFQPSSQLSFQPSGQPSHQPSEQTSSQPSLQSSKQPSYQPTSREPTLSPSRQPLSQPPVISVSCPPVGDSLNLPASETKLTFERSLSNTFCGIYIRRTTNNGGISLIPYARSYNNYIWEAAPGPYASPSENIACIGQRCEIELAPLADSSNESYIILTKDGRVDERKQIARFLEMTTFGTTKAEINDLAANGSWDASSRAQYVRKQMDIDITSHREYYRKRANAKGWESSNTARPSHPCSPNSLWRRYTFIEKDARSLVELTFEKVPEEIDDVRIYEADGYDFVSDCGNCGFRNDEVDDDIHSGYSGRGYYAFKNSNDDYIEWTVNIDEDGDYPIAFRYSIRNSRYSIGKTDRPLSVYVNGNLIKAGYDFRWTGSWSEWRYSSMLEVPLTEGENSISLVLEDDDGPNVDHMRIGKPPAVIIKRNGQVRTIVRDGVGLSNRWIANDITTATDVTFFEEDEDYPKPPGGLWKKRYGSTELSLSLDGDERIGELDVGNPPIDFTGYEQYLPDDYFQFGSGDVFVDTGSQLYEYPLLEGQELLLKNGLNDPICDSFPTENDAPVFGRLPTGEFVQWTSAISLEDNGPSINTKSQDMADYTLSDGGGSIKTESNGYVGCSNAPRTFMNEETCLLSNEPSACLPNNYFARVQYGRQIRVTPSNIIKFNEVSDRYVYAIRGLPLEYTGFQHQCKGISSRWMVSTGDCTDPASGLGEDTVKALEDAIIEAEAEGSANDYVIDIKRTFECDDDDISASSIEMQLEVNGNCYIHVHPDHLNVYDFTGWVSVHPGGEENIKKWAEGGGWYLDFPSGGDQARNIPQHYGDYWDDNLDFLEYIGRLGDSIRYSDLPSELKTNDVGGEYFGSPPNIIASEGGTVVCGSIGEVSNDPTLHEVFDVASYGTSTARSDVLNNHKQVVWTEISLSAKDQLRQRMAWALSQIIPVVPDDLSSSYRTEKSVHFYDTLVRNSFGNYLDILREISYSPLMAEQLSYLESKSTAYVYSKMNKRISSADENFSREVMQLFTIGLIKLNDDGTPIRDTATGKPLETYTNVDVMSLARAWTGFVESAARGNIEVGRGQSRIDPLQIIPDWRDPFPKSDLYGGYIGDRYVLCKDLPDRSFLMKGATYRLLGGKSLPDLMQDPDEFADDANNSILRVELDQSSQLYEILNNGGNYKLMVELTDNLSCKGIECNVDTLRVVKVGTVYYEFVQQPCVHLGFYQEGKKIQLRDSSQKQGQMCADPQLAHAREACCSAEDVAYMETGVTYLYEGERMTWATAKDRCETVGKDLCDFKSVSVNPSNDEFRMGHHWTNQDCSISVKVNSGGDVAIVHGIDTGNSDTVPYHVNSEHTLNWFRVYWNDGDYPGSSSSNTCAARNCGETEDGNCLCTTTVAESVVFDNINPLSKIDVLSQLFIGATGPQNFSVPSPGDGFIAHIVANAVDASTVFEVQDNGKTFFLKNIKSTVKLSTDNIPAPSFRNPPHFMSLIANTDLPGVGEQTLRDAQYETEAVLEQYVYHDNVAPFLCTRITQRLGNSNPSPRYVASCVEAFRTGSYSSGSVSFGDGKYGSLEAMAAAITLDEEATDPSLTVDPTHGSIREPILKVLSLMRSMEYKTDIPDVPDSPAMSKDFQVRLWQMDQKIGQSPHEFPTIFSFFLADYVPDSGPTLPAGLVSPEAKLATMPNTLQLLSGMWSLIKYGLSECDNGFSTDPGLSPECRDNGRFEGSYGKLFYQPDGATSVERATDLALLLTAGRLNDNNLATIMDACASQPDEASEVRCMQQLIVATPEFHSTNTVTQSSKDRFSQAATGDSPEPYKAIVYLYLSGGVDSFNLLAPHTCAPIDVYDRYRNIRGDVGLDREDLLEIPANNPAQPCSSFGIHKDFKILKDLYDNVNFIANAGLLFRPADTNNYEDEPTIQLFAHNTMEAETNRDDIENVYIGTGVGGRIADTLTQSGVPTNTFSIYGEQEFLSPGVAGEPSPYTLHHRGLSDFNDEWDEMIKKLNNATTSDSGFFAETYSSKVTGAVIKHKTLKNVFDASTATEFPDNKWAAQLKMVSQLMQSAPARGVKRDIFFVRQGGYDTHKNVAPRLAENFSIMNAALEAFVEELKEKGLWESTVVLQFSEFGRTLSPNTGDGTGHGWGGNHFMLGGSVKGGKVLGQYPSDFEEGEDNPIALSRGRMVPTTPWDAMWKGAAEWFGIPATGPEMEKVLPMHKNFPPELLYGKDDLFVA